jgi:hypothetical protein
MRDVVRGIARAHLVIADVTGLNGNVMYELGVAHGLGRPTVILAQSIGEVPFDLRSYRVQEYSTHFRDALQLRAELVAIAQSHLRGEVSFGSPVSDFGDVEIPSLQRGAATPSQRPEPDRAHADEEPGFLDSLQDFSEASTVFVTSFGTLSAETVAVGAEVAQLTERIEKLNAAEPGATAARQYRVIAIKAAGLLDRYSDRLEEFLPETEEASERILNSGLAYVTSVRDNGDEETVRSLRRTSEETLTAVRPAMEGIAEFRESILGLRGISSPLTTASKRAARNMDHIISVGERIESFAERTLSLLEDAAAFGGDDDTPA